MVCGQPHLHVHYGSRARVSVERRCNALQVAATAVLWLFSIMWPPLLCNSTTFHECTCLILRAPFAGMYTERQERMLKMEKHYEQLLKSAQKYQQACRQLGTASAEMAQQIQELYVEAPAEYSAGLTSVISTLMAIDDTHRRAADEVFSNGVIQPLQAKLNSFDELHKEMNHREYVMLDYSSRLRRTNAAKEKSKTDSAELARKESKLQGTKDQLLESTATLFKRFDYIESRRYCGAAAEVNAIIKAQRLFMGGAAGALDRTLAMPYDVAPVPPLATSHTTTPFGPAGWDNLPEVERGVDGFTPLPDAGGIGGVPPRARPGGANSGSSEPTPVVAADSGSSSSGQAARGPPALPSAAPPNTIVGGASAVGEATRAAPVAAATAAGAAAATAEDSPNPTSSGGNPFAAGSKVAGGGAPATAPPPAPSQPVPAQNKAQAAYDYKPMNGDELELARGDVLVIEEKHDDGWCTGMNERTGARGVFPANYTKPLD